MAERIGISLSQLYRYILLAKLDEKFVDAIGGHRAAKVVHARDINSALKRPHHTQMMLDEAALIIKEQIERKESGEKPIQPGDVVRSEEHTSELQSLMRISYAVFCLKKKTQQHITNNQY